MTTETTETLHKKAFDAVQLALGDAYDCDLAWSAWAWRNMADEDFWPVDKNPERVREIADAALDAAGFDELLAERDILLAENKRLRKAIIEGVYDIRSSINEMEKFV